MRNRNNMISKLVLKGVVIEDEDHLRRIIHDHFKNIFGSRIAHMCGWGHPTQSNHLYGWPETMVNISKPFIEEEIKTAVCGWGANKSTRP